ncbi:MAG: Lrp/AsnC family transcriptional regulator [Planctomycetes bacterium]|nr:Lrp/AsnC family transcriptional regulator [Planctomycetota bacterium]
MDKLDRQIITELQMDFPISPDPYGIIADRLGIDTDILLDRVQALIGSGTIRRIGISVDSRKMGYSSTLAAVRVAPDSVESACEIIETYPEITHSYLRADEFNIWFTVIAISQQRVHEVLEELRVKLNIELSDVLDLPVKQLFKLDARFKPTK